MVVLRDVMSRHYEWVHPDAPAAEALRQMSFLNVGMLPVCQDGRVLGMLPEVAGDVAGLKVRDVMTPEVLTGREEQDVRDVISVMRTRDIRTLPVLNERGELSGVFTLGGPWKRGEGPRGAPALVRLPRAEPPRRPSRGGRRRSN